MRHSLGKTNIKDFTRGWFIGDFEPSLLKTKGFEVMARHDVKGNRYPRHFHKEATEYVLHIGGVHKVDGNIYKDGEMLVIKPYRSVDYECLENGTTLCVKVPSRPKDKFLGNVLNIVVLMGGRATRFWSSLKPLADIGGKPMIERVIENLRPKRKHRFIFVCLKHHFRQLNYLEEFGEIIWLDEVTEGPACSALAAKKLVNNNDPLLISDCDQLIEMDLNGYYDSDKDATILVGKSDNPAFSYVRLKGERVIETAEKKVISNLATCGKHLFKHGKYFVEGAQKMIARNKRVRGEFYITPLYNEILDKNIGVYEAQGWHDLGTPENLQNYLEGK